LKRGWGSFKKDHEKLSNLLERNNFPKIVPEIAGISAPSKAEEKAATLMHYS
jgi:hypothetical protein